MCFIGWVAVEQRPGLNGHTNAPMITYQSEVHKVILCSSSFFGDHLRLFKYFRTFVTSSNLTSG